MEAIIKNDILITDPDIAIKRELIGRLTLDNPEKQRKIKLGIWGANSLPDKIRLYSLEGGNIRVPFGELNFIFKNQHKFSHIENRTNPTEKEKEINLAYGVEYYPFQITAVEQALRNRNGLIVAECGAGKTQIGLEIARRLGVRTLWLTHTKDLLNQSLERCKNIWAGYDPADLGTITEGKIKKGDFITFATVQTASRIDRRYLEDFSLVIVDEAHRAVASVEKAKQFSAVVGSIPARYKIGLTATPYRADGLERAIFALLGDVIYTVPKEATEKLRVPIKGIVCDYNWAGGLDIYKGDGTLDYTKLINTVATDEKRNAFIVKLAKNRYEHCPSERGLILSERIEQLENLNNFFKDCGFISEILTGKTPKKERAAILKRAKAGKIQILLSTYQLAKEGLDIPCLDWLILASPIKDKTGIIQSTGRIARRTQGKTQAVVIDIRDFFPYAEPQPLLNIFKKRISILKRVCQKVVFI